MSSSNLLVASHKDPGRVRDYQEDDCRNFPIEHETGQYHLLVVADGMGGHSHGDVASKMAIESLKQFLQYGTWTEPAEGLRRAFAVANDRVHDQGVDMGTTLTAVLFREETHEYWWANVGDSRAYLLDGNALHQLSRDHSEIQVRVDAGQLTQEDARVSKGRNVLLRAIGPSPRVEADVEGPYELEPGQRLLICSDGLHGMLREDELAALASHELQNAAKDLVAAANVAGGKDNITALIAALSDGEDTVWMGPAPARVTKPAAPLFARLGQLGRPGGIGAAAAGLGVFGVTAFVAALALSAGDGGENGPPPVAPEETRASGHERATTTPSLAATETPATSSVPTSSTDGSSVVHDTPLPASTATLTRTPTPPPTATPSATATATPTRTPTPPPSATPSATATATSVGTLSPTATLTPLPIPAPKAEKPSPGAQILLRWEISDSSNVASFTIKHWILKDRVRSDQDPVENLAPSTLSHRIPADPLAGTHCFEVVAIAKVSGEQKASNQVCVP